MEGSSRGALKQARFVGSLSASHIVSLSINLFSACPLTQSSTLFVSLSLLFSSFSLLACLLTVCKISVLPVCISACLACLSHSLTLSLSLSLPLTLSHSHSHILSLSHSLTHSLILSLFLNLSCLSFSECLPVYLSICMFACMPAC